jgi:hypothetical protein
LKINPLPKNQTAHCLPPAALLAFSLLVVRFWFDLAGKKNNGQQTTKDVFEKLSREPIKLRVLKKIFLWF